MKKIFIRASLFVFVGILLVVTSLFIGKNINNVKKQKKVPHSQSISYIVKNFHGNIAVFTKNVRNHPFRITNVYTNRLPRKDQLILEQGIEVETQNELNSLLEDLCS